MKRIIFVFLIITALSCTEDKKENFVIRDHIPEDSELILISPDMNQLIKDFKKNDFLIQSNFSSKSRITKQLSHLQLLNLKNESGLTFSNLSSETFIYTLITKKDSRLIPLDSVQNKVVETMHEEDMKFQRISLNDNKFFLYESGNTTIISNSKQKILESEEKEKILQSKDFNRAYNASDKSKTSIFLQHEKLQPDFFSIFKDLKFPGFKNFTEWSVLDIDLTNTTIKSNGITLSKDEGDFLDVFSNIRPQQSEIGNICPDDFTSFYSVSFSSFKDLYANYRKFRKDSLSLEYPGILDHAREAAAIVLDNGSALALNINEIESARESLAGIGEESESFRGTSIIKLTAQLPFQEIFSELIEIEKGQFYIIQDHFVIFSSNPEILKTFISSYQNSATLANREYFNGLMSSLSSEASMLFVINSTQFANSTTNSKQNDLKFKKNSLAAFQVIKEDDFAHLHGIFSNSEAAAQSNGAKQTSSFKVNNPISKGPFFFKNHRTDQMDIAVQDEKNELYLISNKGNVFWKKNLDSQITSPIFQVDLFKNGNKQLAFSTGYNFEVLDRNGNKVKGYPIKFNQPLTQPLAVFDYDNNRNYRFVLTQNKKVYMVGPKGKAIKGFDFENAASEVIKSPKHIRLGSKDYILIAEESGKLNILSRQGKTRVPVKESIEFSENEWYGYQNSFVSTNPNQNLIKISQNGTVSSTDLGLAENNRIVADRTNLVYLNENELSINSKIVNLDFGLYTDPQLFYIRNRTLVGITDTQTQKVYVFNDKAELLKGFPVYGNSQVDIANADLDSKLELIVKGEENEILLYEF